MIDPHYIILEIKLTAAWQTTVGTEQQKTVKPVSLVLPLPTKSTIQIWVPSAFTLIFLKTSFM
jgi:hypothetical protein